MGAFFSCSVEVTRCYKLTCDCSYCQRKATNAVVPFELFYSTIVGTMTNTPHKPLHPLFHLRWDNYNDVMKSVIPQMLCKPRCCDMTLVCDGINIPCHSVMLAAGSPYFEKLLDHYADSTGSTIISTSKSMALAQAASTAAATAMQISNGVRLCMPRHPNNHEAQIPIFYIAKDVRLSVIMTILKFLYEGEITVSGNDLPELVRSAKRLSITSLKDIEPYEIQLGVNFAPSQKPLPTPPSLSTPAATSGSKSANARQQPAASARNDIVASGSGQQQPVRLIVRRRESIKPRTSTNITKQMLAQHLAVKQNSSRIANKKAK